MKRKMSILVSTFVIAAFGLVASSTDAGVKSRRMVKRAQKCKSPKKTAKSRKWYCPEGGTLVLTKSSHKNLKVHQRDGMVCVAMPKSRDRCKGAFMLWNFTDVKSWAGAFCNWVFTYQDRGDNRQTFACLAPPRKKK
jgi:hypothetical protein